MDVIYAANSNLELLLRNEFIGYHEGKCILNSKTEFLYIYYNFS